MPRPGTPLPGACLARPKLDNADADRVFQAADRRDPRGSTIVTVDPART
jgi:hypothetical protein